MPGENILQTVQKIASSLHRLDVQAEEIRELRAAVNAGLDKLTDQVTELRERITRLEASYESDLPRRVAQLEASRQADRAQVQADLARFKAEVERAEYRISRLLSQQPQPPALHGREDDDDELP